MNPTDARGVDDWLREHLTTWLHDPTFVIVMVILGIAVLASLVRRR